MTTKLISAFAAAALTATLAVTSAAEAGGCGHHVFQSFASASYSTSQNLLAKKRAKELAAARQQKVLAAKKALAAKSASETEVASEKIEETPESPETAADETASETTVASAETGCKRFIPAVGATVSVDCPAK